MTGAWSTSMASASRRRAYLGPRATRGQANSAMKRTGSRPPLIAMTLAPERSPPITHNTLGPYRQCSGETAGGGSRITTFVLTKNCPLEASCPYQAVFEPSPPPGADRLSKNQDIPRPFVFRAPQTDRSRFEQGERFEFGLVLIGRALDFLPYFVLSFRELAREGLGLNRARCTLERVEQLMPSSAGFEIRNLESPNPPEGLQETAAPSSGARAAGLARPNPTPGT
jgi:hypothetical protein